VLPDATKVTLARVLESIQFFQAGTTSSGCGSPRLRGGRRIGSKCAKSSVALSMWTSRTLSSPGTQLLAESGPGGFAKSGTNLLRDWSMRWVGAGLGTSFLFCSDFPSRRIWKTWISAAFKVELAQENLDYFRALNSVHELCSSVFCSTFDNRSIGTKRFHSGNR
jgi:hypothetical protein